MSKEKIVNLVTFMLFVVGLALKVNHFPGANVVAILAVVSLLAGLLMFGYKANQESGMSSLTNITLIAFLEIITVGTLFKFMHWPGATILLLVSYGLAFLAPIVLIFAEDTVKVSKQYLFSFLVYFVFLISVLPGNPLRTYFGKPIPEAQDIHGGKPMMEDNSHHE